MHIKEYNAFKELLKAAQCTSERYLLAKRLHNLYVNGIFTPKQFMELDNFILDCELNA